MKKIIVAEVVQLRGGSLMPVLSGINANGDVDDALTQTLLTFVMLSAPSHRDIEGLLQSVEAGQYIPEHPEWADWGVNDVDLWLRPPMAEPGHICISNENTVEYSTEEGGQPQQFTYEQFRAALKHWREFRELMAREGKDKLVGQRYEAVFPE
jgi:hypothetical protein